jgi:hypothetical protein
VDTPIQVNRSPTGKLNSDTDLLYLNGGDYPARENVEFNANGAEFTDTPALGNLQVSTLGIQGLQQQKIRIYLDIYVANPFTSVSLKFYNINKQLLNFRFETSVPFLVQNKAAIVNAIQSMPYVATFENDTNTEPYLDVTIDFFYSDYVLTLEDNLGNLITTAILEEAVSRTGVGVFKAIGSKDIIGNLFIAATTQQNLRTKFFDVTLVGQDNGEAVIYTSSTAGLLTNQTVQISGITGDGDAANGTWTINVLSPTRFRLNGSDGTSLPIIPADFGGFIYIYPFGYGMIGVQEYFPDTDTYSFKPLLRSKALNFVTLKQLDIDGELNNQGYLLKLTDDYNVPRTFSYSGDFVTDGAIRAINPDGQYAYDTVGIETSNLLNINNVTLTVLPQIQSGGNLNAGNKRYAVRLITQSLSESPISLLTNPIPVFTRASGANGDHGNNSTVFTSKINQIQVDDIVPGVFNFIDLICFNYNGGSSNSVAIDAITVRRERLDQDQTSIVLEHNGNETNSTFFDATNNSFSSVDILRAGSNVLCENRLVYGKITTSAELDLTEWVSTFNYSIKRKEILQSKSINEAATTNEFYDPSNTTNFVGYQQYEWYRFYVAGRVRSTGAITKSFFAFDVRFVSQDDYAANAEFQFLETNSTPLRRVFAGDEMIDYDLGNSSYFYQLGIEVKDINWNFQIDGQLASELFEEVIITRAERVDEVLASGVINLACNNYRDNPPLGSGIQRVLQDFPFSIKQANSNSFTPADITYITSSVDSSTRFRAFGSFYSPDILFGKTEIKYTNGDKLINMGNQKVIQTKRQRFASGTNADSFYRVFSPVNGNQFAIAYGLNFVTVVPSDSEVSITTQFKYTKKVTALSFNDSSDLYSTVGREQTAPVLGFKGDVFDPGFNSDFGIYQSLYFREKKDKYGSNTGSQIPCVYTGFSIPSGTTELTVFGGDVFTQSTWLKKYYRCTDDYLDTNPDNYDGQGINPVPSNGSAGGFNIISQNRTNTNLRTWDNSLTNNLLYPVSTPLSVTWLENLPIYPDQITKNSAYEIKNDVQAQAIFNKDIQNNVQAYTRKYWSELRPTNSLTDRYRQFLPLNFQDNPNTFGWITDLKVANGELLSFQQRGFTRDFFNNVGRLQTVESGTVNIGDASVLSRPGLRLSQIGSRHKWSVVKGLSSSGKDVLIWLNDEFSSIMRFGQDGTVNISERGNIKTFLRDRMRFIRGKYTPANNQGVHAVWDNIGKNFIITARGWKDTDDWSTKIYYQVGQTVIYGEQYGIPVIYESLVNSNQGNVPSNTAVWERKQFSDLDYYSLFTLVYNEQKNGFTHLYTFYPRIYFTQSDRYFSPSPILRDITEQRIYRHRELNGRELEFYGQDHEGFTSYVLNYQPSLGKRYIATAFTTELKPVRVKFETLFINNSGQQIRTGQLLRADFNMRINAAYRGVPLDSQGEPMTGNYLKITTYFAAGEKQKQTNIVTSVRGLLRNATNP